MTSSDSNILPDGFRLTSEAKHTPGPWRVQHGQEIEIVSSSPHLSATVAVVAARGASLTAQADARLLAAAPDMLAVLKWIAASGEAQDCVTGEGHEECISAARAAIAKAEGK